MIQKKLKKTMLVSSAIIIALTGSVKAEDAQIWQKYIGTIADESIPLMPDYSYAGYKLGAQPIPVNHDGLDVFNIVNFGAIANDLLSDQDAIQQAINAAEANGGGVVIFPAGEFLVNTDAENTSTIQISASNIILKGSGSTPGGTVVKMVNHMLLPEGASNWNTPSMFTFSTPSENGATTTITQDESRGSKVIHVADASVFTDKKHIRLIMKANTSANADYLDNKDARDLWTVINNEGIELSEFHEIVSIDLIENTVTLKDPIVDDIKSTMNWTANAYTLLENVGFEDIHFKANFTDPFVHHKDYIHDYAWNGVDMVRVADSWVTRSRFTNVTKAAGMGLAYASSIHTILIDGNAGHTIGNIGGNSSRVLQGLIWDNTNNGTFHGADISGGSNGSVTWRVESEQGSGWDLHANQPRTNLVDNYASTGISSIGGNVVNLPNHLTGLTLWNQSTTETTQTDPINFWPGDCAGNYCGPTLVSPIIVGYHGNETTFEAVNVKYQESIGTKVTPESLYEAELTHRLVDVTPSAKSESFTNMTVLGWNKETFIGDNGIEWTFKQNVKSLSPGYIDETQGILFQGQAAQPVAERDVSIQSGTITGGISSLTIDAIDKWDAGNERIVELFINDISIGTYAHTGGEKYVIEFNDINVAGNFTLALKNLSTDASGDANNAVAIDNISWLPFGNESSNWTTEAKAQFNKLKTDWYSAGVLVTGITLSSESEQMTTGRQITLTPELTPSFATDTSVTWSSSNEAIAKVDSAGIVTAISAGSATITATTNDGGFTATTVITSIEEQNRETFTNLPYEGWPENHDPLTYVGANDIEWTVKDVKGVKDYINSTAQIYFLGKPSDRFVAVQSGIISGGISSFAVEAVDLFDGGAERKLELLINDEVVGTHSNTGSDVYMIEFNNINIDGDFTIGLRNVSEGDSNNTIAIDNITWKNYQSDGTGQIVNKAPIVDAGSLQIIERPNSSVTLSGTCTDDELPTADNVTCVWSGPDSVTFEDKNSGATTASFTNVGTYTLTLTSTDGELTTKDQVTITVEPEAKDSSGGSIAYSLCILMLITIRRFIKN